MYEFNLMGQEREPTQEEIWQGLIHHTATLLNLYGAPKHFVARFREIESRPPNKEDVYFIMNKGCDRIDEMKHILSRCPTITIERSGLDDDSQ